MYSCPGGSDDDGSIGRGWTCVVVPPTPYRVGRTVSVVIVFANGGSSGSQQGGDDIGGRCGVLLTLLLTLYRRLVKEYPECKRVQGLTRDP